MASTTASGQSPTNSLNDSSITSSDAPPHPAVPSLSQRTEHVSSARSVLSLASAENSREPSPSRQWLLPNSIYHSRDASARAYPQLFNKTRSTSVPDDGPNGHSVGHVHRTMSTTTPFSQKPTSLNDAVNKLFKLQKQQNGSAEGAFTHSPMSSPLQRSPPQSTSSRRNSSGSTRQSESESTELSSNNPGGSSSHALLQERDISLKQAPKIQTTNTVQNSAGSKVPRGFSSLSSTLETVEEGDHPITPSQGLTSSASSIAPSIKTIELGQEQMTSDSGKDDISSLDGGDANSLSRVPTVTPQRQNEEKDRKSEARRESSSRSSFPVTRRPFTSLVPTKVRAGNDGSARLMTVETETVSSIPQTSVAGNPGERNGTGRREDSGTLRTRPSNETIKPKKEKKRSSKKAPSIISGTASSKADIFEAKVASAVDEDSSDSDETFVYESNPPEPRARQHRHHSRTPSVSSMQSLDRRGPRAMGAMLDGPRRLRGKRSMKFASNQYSISNVDDESGDGGQLTPRASNNRSTITSDIQNRHGVVYSRNQVAQLSPSDRESLSYFSKTRNLHGHEFRSSSKTQSPNPNTIPHSRPQSRKGELPYDFDAERADDERAPLIGSIRSQRTRASRRPRGSTQQPVDFYQEPERGWFRRFAGCFIMFVTIIFLVMGAAAFLYATTKPLYNVNVREIQRVIASEQAIMLDLLVEAVNPNVISLTIYEMDVNLFAKSRHTGIDTPPSQNGSSLQVSRSKRSGRERKQWISALTAQNSIRITQGVDKGTDTEEDPTNDPQTMLLGRVLHFDSALVFDGSPISRNAQNSSAELRLARPGNKTDDDGSERWEHMVQHPFELIVRGILKYQLPLSSKTMTASIGGSVVVHPEEGIDGDGAMKTDKVTRAFWDP